MIMNNKDFSIPLRFSRNDRIKKRKYEKNSINISKFGGHFRDVIV